MFLDKVKIVKILNLTTSDVDGEALNALRMANRMIKSAELTWEKIIMGIPSDKKEEPKNYGFRAEKKEEPKKERPKARDWNNPTIEMMFEVCLEENPDNDFLNSVHDYWEKWGRLTPRQHAALRKFYNNLAGYDNVEREDWF